METRTATPLDEPCIRKIAELIEWPPGWTWKRWDPRYDEGVILLDEEGRCVGAAWYRGRQRGVDKYLIKERQSYIPYTNRRLQAEAWLGRRVAVQGARRLGLADAFLIRRSAPR
jgi:hypothetical protein